MNVEGVGNFSWRRDHWECVPSALGGATINIESEIISTQHEARIRAICSTWKAVVDRSLAYIEARRSEYRLEASEFYDPNAIVVTGSEWSVYFDTNHELEAIVGVEYRDDEPFQLVVSD